MDHRDYAMYRGRVSSAMRGDWGQQLLRDLLEFMDGMPVKRLIREKLVDGSDVCLLGDGAKGRNFDCIDDIDPEDHQVLADLFNVAPCMIQEIEFTNDDEFRLGFLHEFSRRWSWVTPHACYSAGMRSPYLSAAMDLRFLCSGLR